MGLLALHERDGRRRVLTGRRRPRAPINCLPPLGAAATLRRLWPRDDWSSREKNHGNKMATEDRPADRRRTEVSAWCRLELLDFSLF
jgi:hypothetical protein